MPGLSRSSRADAAQAIAAYHYSRFGREPLTAAELKNIADDVGIIVPARPDMTLRGAKDTAGRRLFKIGGGLIRPSVHGEQYMKEKFAVSKGKLKRDPGPPE